MRLLASRVYLSLQLSRRWKLVVFSCAMLSNAISVANVFPYAPLMVEHLGMTHDRRELGFYAGFLMASYMIGSMLTQYHLGMLCDRWGRKKVILLGLASGTLPPGCSRGMSAGYWARADSPSAPGAGARAHRN